MQKNRNLFVYFCRQIIMMKDEPQYISKKDAYNRAAQWCAYQERAHMEVRNKLYAWNTSSRDVDEVISMLIADNFLN